VGTRVNRVVDHATSYFEHFRMQRKTLTGYADHECPTLRKSSDTAEEVLWPATAASTNSTLPHIESNNLEHK
jgi:hypothetical protein